MSCGLSLGLRGEKSVWGAGGRLTLMYWYMDWLTGGRGHLKDKNPSNYFIHYYVSWWATFVPTALKSYYPRLPQSSHPLASLALFKNHGPKFHFSPRWLWETFTVLTLVCAAGSKGIPVLYSFNCSPRLVLINLLTHEIPCGGGNIVGKHL